jgi:hypothetical protein
MKTIANVEIADKSTEALMNWNDAMEYTKSLGDGWRLPTKEELYLIYKSTNDFMDGTYWSIDEDSSGNAMLQNFYSGYQYAADKRNGTCVRAVRDNQLDLFA